ncbi:hypothetical protein JST99_02980 [Candidatus Dependentiae bacterium]|nr:hypothetical protein [Candidatus Dependentiae bacterium]MCC7414810.1 hypothetical protein [Campylobacterota bacterium]
MTIIRRFFFAFSCIAIYNNISASESKKTYSKHTSLPLPYGHLALSRISEEPSPSERRSTNSISPSVNGPLEPEKTPSEGKWEMQPGSTPTSISVTVLVPKQPKHFDFSQGQDMCTPDIKASQPTEGETVEETLRFATKEIADLASQSAAYGTRKSIRHVDLDKAAYRGDNEQEESADMHTSKCSLWRCLIACCGISV